MKYMGFTIYLTAAAFLAGVPQAVLAGGCGVYGGYASYAYPSYSYGYAQPYTYSYYPVKTYYQQPVVVLSYQAVEVPLFSVGGTGYRTAAPQTVSSTTTTTTTASATTAGSTAASSTVNGVPAASTANALGAGVSACEAQTSALRKELEALRAEMRSMRPTPQVDPAPAFQSGFRAGVNRGGAFATKCAVCHTATTAEEFGGGKILAGADGQLTADVSQSLLTKIVTKSYSGAMPPKGNAKGVQPLTDGEVAEIMADVDKMQKTASR